MHEPPWRCTSMLASNTHAQHQQPSLLLICFCHQQLQTNSPSTITPLFVPSFSHKCKPLVLKASMQAHHTTHSWLFGCGLQCWFNNQLKSLPASFNHHNVMNYCHGDELIMNFVLFQLNECELMQVTSTKQECFTFCVDNTAILPSFVSALPVPNRQNHNDQQSTQSRRSGADSRDCSCGETPRWIDNPWWGLTWTYKKK